MDYKLSKYQENILDKVHNTNNNLLVDAKAGSGKTSTLLLIANELKQQNKNCLFLAFNKSIVDELSQKIDPQNCLVKTLHSLGLSFIRSYLYKKHQTNYDINVNTSKVREIVTPIYKDYCLEKVEFFNSDLDKTNLNSLHRDYIDDFITIINFSRLYNVNYKKEGSLDWIINRFCWNLTTNTPGLNNYQDVVIKCIDKIKYLFEHPDFEDDKYIYELDYTDMIYFPVYYNMYVPYSLKQYLDCVLVDECVPGNTFIVTNKGKKPIKFLYKLYTQDRNRLNKLQVRTYNEQTKEFEFKHIVSVTKKDVRDIFQITTDNGNRYRATNNHLFLTPNGYVRLDNLKINEDYLISGNGSLEKVVKIDFYNKMRVYDMEVYDNHNFLISIITRKTFDDSVVVHNCQDLSILQQYFIRQLDTGTNRYIFVGDRYQAIYGFAGADTHSVDNIKHNFNIEELPLNICYRCPENVIKLAQDIVPDITWNKDRSDKGLVKFIEKEKFKTMLQPRDLIIARKNKDLVEIYRTLVIEDKIQVKFRNQQLVNQIVKDLESCVKEYILRYNKGLNVDKYVYEKLDKFRIENRLIDLSKEELEKNLLYKNEKEKVVKKAIKENLKDKTISKSNHNIYYLLKCMKEYKELGSFNYLERQVDKEKIDILIYDYYKIIISFINEFKLTNTSILVQDFIMYLKRFLTSNTNLDVPILSSIHSMKGGEGDTVFIYNYPEFPYESDRMSDEEKQQERNLMYVAITRAKQNLYLIKCKDDTRNLECESKVDSLLKG